MHAIKIPEQSLELVGLALVQAVKELEAEAKKACEYQFEAVDIQAADIARCSLRRMCDGFLASGFREPLTFVEVCLLVGSIIRFYRRLGITEIPQWCFELEEYDGKIG